MMQAKLIIAFANKQLTLEQYFHQQELLDQLSPSGEECSWDSLKKDDFETYQHEQVHKKVANKYGFTAKVYKINDKVHYVDRPDFKDVVIKKGYTLDQVIEIEKEGNIAPHVGKSSVDTGDKLDILYYEIYCRNIKEITPAALLTAFQKYNWVYSKHTMPKQT